DVWDFMERLAGSVNRKSLETMVFSGAFDSFGYKRGQFYTAGRSGELFLDELVRYADLYKNDLLDSSTSLFGEVEEMKPVRPEMPALIGEEDTLALLQQEKEYVGMYLSSHPLDRYAFEIENFTDCRLSALGGKIDECEKRRTPVKTAVAGIVTDVKNITTKSGSPGAKIILEDFSGTYELALFGKDYEAYMAYMQPHSQLYIEGEIAERYFVKPEERSKDKTVPYAFKIKKISLLGNVGEDHIKSFVITVPDERLNADFRKEFAGILKEFKGKTALGITLTDKKKNYRIEMVSKKYSVSVCEGFINGIQRLGLNYSVIRKN
ncbi:MAG: hypothetical protein MJY51_04645, partial [Bacteroidales bacterium]|nr:hypothetical protein [Bacteroidales bacterium]